jgi:cellulose synthase/poly-beta-1,6-N-acetylglucosamine synthase-like glycosyltransferase
MAEAAKYTSGDFIICTDADTVFDKAAIRELMSSFSDPKVGAVGGTIGIVNVNDTFLSQMQTIFYGTAYWMFKPMENINGATQCLGGPLVAFRRAIYIDIIPEVSLDSRFITEKIGLLHKWCFCVATRRTPILRQNAGSEHQQVGVISSSSSYVGDDLRWGNMFILLPICGIMSNVRA